MKPGLILTILLMVQISACGFHLRGIDQVKTTYSPLFIVADQLTADQLALIRKELVKSSATVNDLAADANRLQVVFTAAKSRKIAGSSLSDFELLQLQMSLQYNLQTASGEQLIEPGELVEKAEIQLDKANVLVNEQTISKAQQELQRKLLRRLVLRLSQ